MPAAIPVITNFLLVVTGATSTFATALAIGAARLFVYVGAQLLLNKAISLLTKRPKRGAVGLETNFSGTLEPRRLIAGTLKVGGMHNIPPINTNRSGYPSKGQFGHCDIIHAGHEVYDITDVYFDQDLIADAVIGAVTGTDADGAVTTGKYGNRTWIRRYLGTSTQTADYILTQALPSAFTSDFRGRGIAHTAVTNWFDDKVFRTGWPQVTALVLGQRLYDPRLDSTKAGGSGSHREDDPTTWGFTGGIGANNALYLRHFLTNEVGFPHSEMIDSMIMAAANICDQTVDIPGGGTQRRYTFNAQLLATEDWEVNLRIIVDSMRGHYAYVDGQWHVWAGGWETPTVTIQPGDWVSPIVVQASANRDERYNRVTGWYVDPDRNWQRMPCYPRRNSSYEIEDGPPTGEVIPVDVELPGCASSAGTKHAEYEAQRHCEFLLRQSRNQIKVSGRLRPEFMKLIPGRTAYLTDPAFGWDSKSFRIIAVEAGIGDGGGANVVLREEGAATWTDLAAGDYNTETVGPSIDPGVTLPELTADPVVTVGATTITFDLSAAIPFDQPPSTDYAIIAHSVGTPATAGTEVYRGRSRVPVIARSDVNTLYYWARAYVNTYASAYRPNTVGLPAAPYLEIVQNEYVKDPDFARSTSTNSLWRVVPHGVVNSATLITSAAIVGSGGLVGGLLSISVPNTSTALRIFSPLPPLRADASDIIEHTVRWRKTSSSNLSANDLYFWAETLLVSSVFTFPNSDWGNEADLDTGATLAGGPAGLYGWMVNSAPINTWQETRQMYRTSIAAIAVNYRHLWNGFRFQSASYSGFNSALRLEFDFLYTRKQSQESASVVPQTSVTAAHVATKQDVGGHLKTTTGGVTINAGVFDVSDLMAYFNNSGSTQSITAGSGVTFRLAGTTTTGSPRTMAVYGIVTLLCVDADTFLLSGNVS